MTAAAERPSRAAVVSALGAWLHPATAFRPRSQPELQLQFRAGVVGLFCVITGGAALVIAVSQAAMTQPLIGPARLPLDLTGLVAAVGLVLISVFAPQAVFRTRSAAYTREVLSNPSAPIRPWRATTITFDAVLVGGMLAGLYYSASLTLAFFGLALLAKAVFTSRRTLDADPNARLHHLVQAWTSGATATAAYLIVSPLSAAVSLTNAVLPLVFAGIVAMYLGLVFNAVERWVTDTRVPWAFARDAVDTRRIVVALVSAGLAWLVSVTGEFVGGLDAVNGDLTGSLAGLGIFVAGWLVLWYASITLWRRDARRTLAMWQEHQAQIMTRLADGSLSPELARRAALPVAARMAISVFGATRAMALIDGDDGQPSTHLVAVDRYENAPAVDATAMGAHPHLHLSCWPIPSQGHAAGVTIASWLWPGWFMTRSRGMVEQFTQLATATLLLPGIAATDDHRAQSFDVMFDSVHRWPTLAAFEEAVDRMRQRADASPHSDSLVIGVYSIDDFGALSGGRFEQAAVAQVMRLALGHTDFAGRDLFVAYESPGRMWVALAGGPVIRTSIDLLRGLQQRINDQGSVPSSRLDVDVHVSVSFGYGAHQVDDFASEGLMATALERLAIDASARQAFPADALLSFDLSPEDIIGQASTPVTAVDVLQQLADDRDQRPDSFPLLVRPVVDAQTGATRALWAAIGWRHAIGQADLADPEAFATLVGRQPELAALAAGIALDTVAGAIAQADAVGRTDLPVMIELPAILVQPEAGQWALPNLAAKILDRRQCARAVILLHTVPQGAGQALRLLSDRGISIAVTAAAAAGADPVDLFGWQRWAVVFPRPLLQGAEGVDSLTVQQTVSAIAGQGTHLIGSVDRQADRRALARHNIRWLADPDEHFDSVRACVEAGHPADADARG